MNAEDEQKLEQELPLLKANLAQVRRKNTYREVKPYTFKTSSDDIELIELFQSSQDLLMIHNMGTRCPYCTAYADGINGVLRHLQRRASVALISNDPPKTQRAFAKARGWEFNMVSAIGTTFSKDMGFEPKPGEFWPGVMGFRKDENAVILVSKAYFDPGDDYCVIWPLFSFLDGGVGNWEPNTEATNREVGIPLPSLQPE